MCGGQKMVSPKMNTENPLPVMGMASWCWDSVGQWQLVCGHKDRFHLGLSYQPLTNISTTTMGRNCMHSIWVFNTQERCTLFSFPTDSKLRKAWTLQVQCTRDKGKALPKVFHCRMQLSSTSKKLGLKMKQFSETLCNPHYLSKTTLIFSCARWSVSA